MLTFSKVTVAVIILILSVLRAGALETPGPSAALLANPTYSSGIGLLYTCIRNFYVTTTGNDGNSGSQVNPWLTIQHADATALQPGDCVNVAAGTYTWTTTFTPTKYGNVASATGYVVYRCQTLDACLIVWNGASAGVMWGPNAPYYIIDGFDIDGGEAAVFGGIACCCVVSGINATGTPGHHIWALNNRVHGCNLTGIAFSDSEYYFAIHNEVFNN